jgi:hypothetical protein
MRKDSVKKISTKLTRKMVKKRGVFHQVGHLVK